MGTAGFPLIPRSGHDTAKGPPLYDRPFCVAEPIPKVTPAPREGQSDTLPEVCSELSILGYARLRGIGQGEFGCPSPGAKRPAADQRPNLVLQLERGQ